MLLTNLGLNSKDHQLSISAQSVILLVVKCLFSLRTTEASQICMLTVVECDTNQRLLWNGDCCGIFVIVTSINVE